MGWSMTDFGTIYLKKKCFKTSIRLIYRPAPRDGVMIFL